MTKSRRASSRYPGCAEDLTTRKKHQQWFREMPIDSEL